MRIAYASDLHLEFDNSFTLTGLSMPTGPADVLVLAGDVEILPMHYVKLLCKLRIVYDGPVIFVLGNHEYYNGVFPDDRQKYREAIAHDPKAYLLENESVVIDGVRFLGAALWTDFAVIEDADSRCITPEAILQAHRDSIAWLDDQFTNHPFAGPTVVITHHAPSYRSQHPRFAGSPISGGFCSNQEHYIQRWQPDVWIHGHVHDPMDYRIGHTRVLCNPWGYPGEGRAREYRIVEV
ncbi:metallophosphoesterase [Acidithiobacillus sulfurivorans]|uniref:Phosphatase n=1 Tax=Acidithiobacillus sulfurivorans TaxID=1958756 RepID=A0ABS6A0G6_9PROT|nr:metallophosphoesterase [Acidithiobacillus sulfurivorans]MBU2760945.1 phosphatase [Acidithiobacillus sulfurivorans]